METLSPKTLSHSYSRHKSQQLYLRSTRDESNLPFLKAAFPVTSFPPQEHFFLHLICFKGNVTTTLDNCRREDLSHDSWRKPAHNPLLFRDWELEDFCSPPSLSLLSAQEVSIATLHPGPLQPVWQTHCQLFWPSMHLPLPLHKSGQPSGWRNEEDKYKKYWFAWRFYTLGTLNNVTVHSKRKPKAVAKTLDSCNAPPPSFHLAWLWEVEGKREMICEGSHEAFGIHFQSQTKLRLSPFQLLPLNYLPLP